MRTFDQAIANAMPDLIRSDPYLSRKQDWHLRCECGEPTSGTKQCFDCDGRPKSTLDQIVEYFEEHNVDKANVSDIAVHLGYKFNSRVVTHQLTALGIAVTNTTGKSKATKQVLRSSVIEVYERGEA